MAFSEKFSKMLEDQELAVKMEGMSEEEQIAFLKAEGIDIEAEYSNVDVTDEEAELSDEALEAVAGGANLSSQDIDMLIKVAKGVFKYGWAGASRLNILIGALRDSKKGNMYSRYTRNEVKNAYNWWASRCGLDPMP